MYVHARAHQYSANRPRGNVPGEFTNSVRRAVEKNDAGVIIIDSLNGYINAMPDERFLVLQMHELLSYLDQLGVR